MIFKILFILFLLTSPAWAIVDINVTIQTQSLYNQLQDAQGDYIYFGQEGFSRYMWGILPDSYLISGKYPYFLEERWGVNGSISLDLVNIENQPLARELMKRHHRQGGFIGIMSDYYVTIPPISAAEILPGGAKRSDYLSKIDNFLTFTNSLIDDNGNLIPILYRPFFENDGNWFWWGCNGSANFSTQDFIDVWQDLVNYIVNTKGVHNLIFVYSPDWNQNGTAAQDRYPGNNYVDIIGIDQYPGALDNGTADDAMPYYQEASDFAMANNKLFAITEGLRKLDTYPMADFWTTGLINPILADSKASKAVYLNIWRGGNLGVWEYGCKFDRNDAPSFLEMSQNSKIKMLKYKSIIKNATLKNATLN